MKHLLKQNIKKIITNTPLLLRTVNKFAGEMPKILMYHRFAPSGMELPGRISQDEFAWQLDTISSNFRIISLAECIDHYTSQGKWPQNCVIITVDDGYRDMYLWAYPELLKRKMPATFFITTRFISGEIWLWPDRLAYAINMTNHDSMTVTIEDRVLNIPLLNLIQNTAAWRLLNDYCIRIDNHQREEFIKYIEATLEVSLPPVPPIDYAGSTWEEIIEMQNNGIEIGAHTKHHPILSKLDVSSLEDEIAGSKLFIEEYTKRRVKSFCYPNGMPDDINDNVIFSVRNAGYDCAVIASMNTRWNVFQIPRLGVSSDKVDFLWKLYGGESL